MPPGAFRDIHLSTALPAALPNVCRALVVVAIVARALGAQAPPSGVVNGSVSDSAGAALAGVEVRALTGVASARTGEDGRFRLAPVPTGAVLLEARRLGFRPETLQVAIGYSESAVVTFRLRAAANTLAAVVVRAERQKHTGRLAGYFERLESNTGGFFVTRDMIDEGDPRQLSDVLRKAPGVDIVRGRVRLRGRSCAPLVWLDGTPMPAGEVDINSLPPRTIEGIEIYSTASGAPFRYQGLRDDAKCGTMLLWSRGPDTDERRRPVLTSVDALEQLRSARAVLMPDEVDVAARPDSATPLAVGYPPELLAAGSGGIVVAEFVVDSSGQVEPSTFGVLSSTHPLFARAVQEAIARARFVPAQARGVPVRQIVRMQFRFDAPGRRRRP
jgi:TonB family protein